MMMYVSVIVMVLVMASFAVPVSAAEGRFEAEIQQFEAQDRENPPPQGAVLFVGSSSFRLWTDMAGDFPGISLINRGFGGAEFDDVLRLFDRIVTPYRPRLIVVYAGSHDLRSSGGGPTAVLEKFKLMHARVISDLPGTRLAYVSMKPSIAKWDSIDLDREANTLVAAYCGEHDDTTFIDLWPALCEESEPPPSRYFLPDRNHPSRAGYVVWAKAIRPFIE